MFLTLLVLLLAPFYAQVEGSNPPKEFKSEVQRLQAQLVQATKEYKESLSQLLGHYEANVTRSRDRLEKTHALYSGGLVRTRELEDAKAAVVTAEAEVVKVKKQLAGADEQIAQTLRELSDMEKLEKRLQSQPAKRERGPRGRVYFVRFIVIGEVVIYDYSGAVRGRVIKQGQRVRFDSRKK